MEEKKSSPIKNIITVLISLLIAGVFLWIALKDFDFPTFKASLEKANFLWVALAGVFGLFAYWFRAIRWNLLLEPMGHKISNTNSLWSLSFGYLMNLTIPRSGELARSSALYGVEKVPVDKSFGTIILERVIDLVCMFVFLGLTLIFKFDAINSFFANSGAKINPTYIIGIITAGIVGFVLFLKFKEHFRKFGFISKIIDFIDGIIAGLTSILKLKEKSKFLVYTAGIWICYFFASYLVCFALPETRDFSLADGCFILVVGTFGMIIPASGGIGAYNLAMKFGFMALFLSMGKDAAQGGEMGLSYSFITLPLQIIIMLVMGLISIPMLAKNRKV